MYSISGVVISFLQQSHTLLSFYQNQLRFGISQIMMNTVLRILIQQELADICFVNVMGFTVGYARINSTRKNTRKTECQSTECYFFKRNIKMQNLSEIIKKRRTCIYDYRSPANCLPPSSCTLILILSRCVFWGNITSMSFFLKV